MEKKLLKYLTIGVGLLALFLLCLFLKYGVKRVLVVFLIFILAGILNPTHDRYKNRKTYIDENGYRRFLDSKMLVHRWAAEKKLGRKLNEDEVVHHKNRNKLDNRPDNLEVFANQSEHDKVHGYDNSDDGFNGNYFGF